MGSDTGYFGARWDAPMLDDAVEVATPVNWPCVGCDEPIQDGDRGLIRVAIRRGDDGAPYGQFVAIHAECDLRSVMGHQVGVCGCNGHGTTRADARLVWERVSKMRGRDLGELRPQVGPPPAFVCPRCSAKSWHPDDGKHGYCGRCHAFTGEVPRRVRGYVYTAPDGTQSLFAPSDIAIVKDTHD
jgi:hypothetical protein